MRRTPPVAKPLRRKDTIWVEPKFEAIVEARGLTDDGMLRHPTFKGWLTKPSAAIYWFVIVVNTWPQLH
jgi:bifunctional non-homologous end joining protein LigD